MVAAAAPTDVAQDRGVGNPGGLGNEKGSGTLGSDCSLAVAGVGKNLLLDEVHLKFDDENETQLRSIKMNEH